ncbi:MAG TPA: alpha/beta fold hydrolase [Steroidobacteraceae bacterium]|nr:alpha/beta fold hydrolase [Steroidobacteraceae bacterium]
MNTTPLRSWILALGLALTAPAGASGALPLAPCQLEDAAHFNVLGAECGTLEVPENPAAPQGRRIGLHVAVVAAINRRKTLDPLFLLAGGPGMGATTLYAGVAPAFARIHRNRDIVLVDQRGTGQSNVLNCPFDDDVLMRATAAEMEVETQRCLATLSERADVSFYTTSVAVQDLDRVRAALGYNRINLYGGSYGTRVAEHYLRRFPTRTRSLILDGVVPPQLALGPDIALDAENALMSILSRCARDASCKARFGDPAATYHQLRDSLQSRVVPVSVADPTTAVPVQLDFGPMQFATVLRLSTYTSEQAAVLPLVLDLANRSGNFAPLAAQFLLMMRSYGDVLAYGMHNSVVCTEDVPFYQPDTIDRAKLTRTFLGTTQLDALVSLCKGWPRGPMDADLHAPLRSEVPVLLLSGGNDPVTPAAYAEQTLAGLKRGLHVVIPDLGHGQLGAPCMDRVMEQFIDDGSADKLDVSCTKLAKPAPFFISTAGPSP